MVSSLNMIFWELYDYVLLFSVLFQILIAANERAEATEVDRQITV